MQKSIFLLFMAALMGACMRQPVHVTGCTTEAIPVDTSSDCLQDTVYLAQLAPVKADLEREFIETRRYTITGSCEMVSEGGVSVQVDPKGTGQFVSFRSLSGGEKAVVAFLLMLMFASISGAGIMILDELSVLDESVLDALLLILKEHEDIGRIYLHYPNLNSTEIDRTERKNKIPALRKYAAVGKKMDGRGFFIFHEIPDKITSKSISKRILHERADH